MKYTPDAIVESFLIDSTILVLYLLELSALVLDILLLAGHGGHKRMHASFEILEERYLFAGDLPSLSVLGDSIVLPGNSNDIVTLSATWTLKEAEFDNELIFYEVDNEKGIVDGLNPSDADYAYTALGAENGEVIFTSGEGVGATTEISKPGGTLLASALIQNASLESWLSDNPHNSLTDAPAFFSYEDANPDAFDHLIHTELEGGSVQYFWEDLAFGGDHDFTDVVFTLAVVSIEKAPEQEPRFTLESASTGVTIDEQTGEINWQELSPGTYQLNVTVNDDNAKQNEPPTHVEIPGITDASQIFIDDFESGDYASFWTECSFCSSHSSVADDGTGNLVFETKYSKDEDAALLSLYPLRDVESIYVSFNQKLPTGLPERALKSARVFRASGDKEGTLSLQFWPLEGIQKLVTEYQATGSGDYTPLDAAIDEWVRVSFLMQQNEPGVENGILQVWRNDELVLDRNDVRFRNSPTQPDGVWLGGNYSGAGVDPKPFSRLLDDILIVTNPAEDFDHVAAIDALFSQS